MYSLAMKREAKISTLISLHGAHQVDQEMTDLRPRCKRPNCPYLPHPSQGHGFCCHRCRDDGHHGPNCARRPKDPEVIGVWDWMHDGVRLTGSLDFLLDGRVRWCGTDGAWQPPGGNWTVVGDELHATFNNVSHALRFEPGNRSAVLLWPERQSPSRMQRRR